MAFLIPSDLSEEKECWLVGTNCARTQDPEVRTRFSWPGSQTPGLSLLGVSQRTKGTLLKKEGEIQSSFQHIPTAGET